MDPQVLSYLGKKALDESHLLTDIAELYSQGTRV